MESTPLQAVLSVTNSRVWPKIVFGVIMITIIIAIVFIFGFGAINSGCQFLETKEDAKAENSVTKINKIMNLTEKNASCTSFAAYLAAQQVAKGEKGSDQNLAESVINVCNTQMILETCKQFTNKIERDECYGLFRQRK